MQKFQFMALAMGSVDGSCRLDNPKSVPNNLELLWPRSISPFTILNLRGSVDQNDGLVHLGNLHLASICDPRHKYGKKTDFGTF
jgi:hypothetical protein